MGQPLNGWPRAARARGGTSPAKIEGTTPQLLVLFADLGQASLELLAFLGQLTAAVMAGIELLKQRGGL